MSKLKNNQELINTIGTNIKKLREKNGLTRTELASKLGLTVQAVSQYENCNRLPSDKILEKIAEVLNVPLHLFMSNEELLNKWDLDLNVDRLSKEVKFLELIKDLYPDDFDFIVELFGRMGLINTKDSEANAKKEKE